MDLRLVGKPAPTSTPTGTEQDAESVENMTGFLKLAVELLHLNQSRGFSTKLLCRGR